jgi:pimeloyl-ACP methyl ester carboxylesterase
MDIGLGDGRTLHVYDSGIVEAANLALVWHHGSPGTGDLLAPLLRAAAGHGARLVSYDRPGYGPSTSQPGRHVASAAADVSEIADALGIGKFVALGASGGGPHALACGALLPERAVGVLCIASLAPFAAPGLDWFGQMAAPGAAELHAALEGRAALGAYLSASEFDPELFTPADHAALSGDWSSLAASAGQGVAGGLDGLVDDNRAFVTEWGFDVAQIVAPVVVLQGGQDRWVPASHAQWLARRCPSADLWLRPDEGHVSVLTYCQEALGSLIGRLPSS